VVYGIHESKTMAGEFVNNAKISLQIFGERTQYFNQLADYIISRTH
jgi:geranylgeranyl pyrophosphate synthase